jgi:hypothetical protein
MAVCVCAAHAQVTTQRLAACVERTTELADVFGGYYSQRYSTLDQNHAGQCPRT